MLCFLLFRLSPWKPWNPPTNNYLCCLSSSSVYFLGLFSLLFLTPPVSLPVLTPRISISDSSLSCLSLLPSSSISLLLFHFCNLLWIFLSLSLLSKTETAQEHVKSISLDFLKIFQNKPQGSVKAYLPKSSYTKRLVPVPDTVSFTYTHTCLFYFLFKQWR